MWLYIYFLMFTYSNVTVHLFLNVYFTVMWLYIYLLMFIYSNVTVHLFINVYLQ